MICKYLLPSGRLPLPFAAGFQLLWKKHFSFMQSHLFIFALDALAWGDGSKTVSGDWWRRADACCFLLEFCGFRTYTQVFNPFWLYFYTWCYVLGQIHSFAWSCSVFPKAFIEVTVFFPLDTLASFVINGQCLRVYPRFSVLFCWPICLFLHQDNAAGVTIALSYSLNQGAWYFQFRFLKLALAVCHPLRFSASVILSSGSVKNVIDIWQGLHRICIFWGQWLFNSISSSNLWVWDLSIRSIFNFFQLCLIVFQVQVFHLYG